MFLNIWGRIQLDLELFLDPKLLKRRSRLRNNSFRIHNAAFYLDVDTESSP